MRAEIAFLLRLTPLTIGSSIAPIVQTDTHQIIYVSIATSNGNVTRHDASFELSLSD